MHVHNGEDLNGLLRIEYGFHVTLMAAGLVLAYSFLTMLRVGEADGEPAPTRVSQVKGVYLTCVPSLTAYSLPY